MAKKYLKIPSSSEAQKNLLRTTRELRQELAELHDGLVQLVVDTQEALEAAGTAYSIVAQEYGYYKKDHLN